MQIIQFQIKDQVVTWSCPGRDTIAGSEGQVMARFAFDAEWDQLSITLIFSNNVVEDPVSVIFTGEDVLIPPRLLKDGFLRVSAVGLAAKGENPVRLTTKHMAHGIRVFRCGPIDGLPEDETSPALWEQALALIGPVSKLDTKDKSSLVAAINEVNRTPGGPDSPGTPGATFIPHVSADGTLSWSNNGDLPNPDPINLTGPPGTSVTVSSVTESTEDGGVNVVTFSDGKKLNVRNGKKGDPGYTPQKGIDYFDGTKGDPGYTPQKGTDYFTEADKQELVAAVLTALPRAEEAEF